MFLYRLNSATSIAVRLGSPEKSRMSSLVMPSERKSGSSSSLASASGARRSPSDAMNASISMPKNDSAFHRSGSCTVRLPFSRRFKYASGDAERARDVGLLEAPLEAKLAQSATDIGVVTQAAHA